MNIPAGLKPYFQAAVILGAVAMVFDTLLSAKFGWSISYDMAGIFALVSLASGVLLVIAAAFWRSGHAGLAKGIALAWVPIFAFNVMSNMGVATANRMADVQKASVQQTKFDAAQDNTKEAAENLKLWTSQLTKLKTDNAWVASVTADSLRSQLTELQAAADRESKRGGCASKCEAIKVQVRDTQAKIGAVEQRDDLTKRIDATERLVAKYREKAGTTEAGHSQAANQSQFFAKLMSFSLYADPSTQDVGVANEGMGMFTALVLALVSALLTYVGAYPHLQEIGSGQASRAPTKPAAFNPLTSVPSVPPVEARYAPPPTTTEKHTHTNQMLQPIMVDDSKWKAMIDKLVNDHRVPEIKAA